MSTISIREKKATEAMRKQKNKNEDNNYKVASESLSVDEKLRILEDMGRKDLIDIFKGWSPRTSSKKKKSAPLDQRVSITVTTTERLSLDTELQIVKDTGGRITMSQFIRNRALGSVDINGWRDIAITAMKELEDVAKNQGSLRKQKNNLIKRLEATDDNEDAALIERDINKINISLSKIVAQNEKRNNRLSGRMSMTEAETIKWRAQRLCISSSDYLRMMIFGLEPDSSADSHMSLDAKRRFYVSIMDVADNGWGEPPTIYQCSQCENYMDTILQLREEVKQLRNFA